MPKPAELITAEKQNEIIEESSTGCSLHLSKSKTAKSKNNSPATKNFDRKTCAIQKLVVNLHPLKGNNNAHEQQRLLLLREEGVRISTL